MCVSTSHLYNIHDSETVFTDNYPQAGKRPLSSIVPTIIEDEHGRFVTALGASGGSKIFPSVFQVLANLDWGMDASSAIEFGRLHDQLYPMHVEVDNVYPPEIIEDLKRKGHNITSKCEVQVRRFTVLTCHAVADISRVAAVVQVITKKGDTIYGELHS